MIEIEKIIKSITSVMPCEKCPYPCEAKENSSLANCHRRWFEILSNVDVNKSYKDVSDWLFRNQESNITKKER